MNDPIASFIAVPYLPVLGPVYPDEVTERLIEDIYASSQRNTLLPYDKSGRWSDEPTEQIYENGITHYPHGLTIRTKAKNGDRYYYYGDTPEIPATGTAITFSQTPKGLQPGESCSVIFLDEYKESETHEPNNHVRYAYELDDNYIQQLLDLGDPASHGGFAMLIEKRMITSREAPTLVYVNEGEVLGAIGPLTIMKDSRGIDRVLPCYFAVKDTTRRQGIGAVLWQAVRTWAYDHHAQYKILQAEYGTPAERFYQRQGLRRLGCVYRKVVASE